MSNELKNFKSALLGALPFPVGRPRRCRCRCRRHCYPTPPLPHWLTTLTQTTLHFWLLSSVGAEKFAVSSHHGRL